MSIYEPKSIEEVREIGKELRDFAAGHLPQKPLMAKDMTLRDYFAGQIVSSFLNQNSEPTAFPLISFLTYKLADEMLKERDSNEC